MPIIRSVIILLILFAKPVAAANTDTLIFQPALERLRILGDTILAGTSDESKENASQLFEQLLDSILHKPGGTALSFHNVKALSLTASGNNFLRMYNWMLTLDRGNTFKFYGFAAGRKDKKTEFRVWKLQEKKYSDNEATEALKLDSAAWLGCIYYKIIHLRHAKKDSYIALGWAPQSSQTTRKIIEPIVFTPTKITFGAAVLKSKGNKTKLRSIFEYNARASMSLRYEEKNKRIVFDHLAPSDPRPESKGVYSMYGPDLSYDGYEFIKGSWILKQDLELNNDGLNQGKEGKFFGK